MTKEKIASSRTLTKICEKELALDMKNWREKRQPATTDVIAGNGESIDREQLAATRREVYELAGSPSMCL